MFDITLNDIFQYQSQFVDTETISFCEIKGKMSISLGEIKGKLSISLGEIKGKMSISLGEIKGKMSISLGEIKGKMSKLMMKTNKSVCLTDMFCIVQVI